MKQSFTLFLFFLGISSLNAQIVLNRSNAIGQLGDTTLATVLAKTVPTIDRSGGQSKTWDFSTLSGDTVPSILYKSVASTTDGSNHAGATMATTSGNPQGIGYSESFIKVSNGKYEITGRYLKGRGRETFTDGRELLTFPLKYGDTQNETMNGTFLNFVSNQTFTRSGNILIKADGEGTIKLPSKTVTALRVLVATDYSDKLGPVTINYQDTLILWYDGVTKMQIASYSVLYSSGLKYSETFSYAILPSSGTGGGTGGGSGGQTSVSTLDGTTVKFYPNPVTDRLVMEQVSMGTQPEVYNLVGEQISVPVEKNETDQKLTLNMEHLDRGIYLIKYEANGKSHVQRIQVK